MTNEKKTVKQNLREMCRDSTPLHMIRRFDNVRQWNTRRRVRAREQ